MQVARLGRKPSVLALVALVVAMVAAVLVSTERGEAFTANKFKIVLAGSGLQAGTITAGAPTQIRLIALNNDGVTIDTTYSGDFQASCSRGT